MKNRVAKLVEIGKIEIFEETIPELKDNEILVAIRSVGICGSDMHYFLEGGLGSFKQPLPMNIGHESSGEILESYGDYGFKKGDRVAVEPARPCFHCDMCLRGMHNHCRGGLFMGATTQGAFADYVIVERRQLAKLPDSMTDNVGALLEPLGVCLHTVNLTKPSATDNATIFGAGPIGLCLLSVLQKIGLREIYVVDTLPYRVEFAKKFGATDAFLYGSAAAEIKKRTENSGTKFAFDAAGSNESIHGCIDVVAAAGTIGLIGIPTEDFITYNPHKLRTKEVTVKNIRRSNQTLEGCVKLYKTDDSIEQIVTHEFSLEDIQEGFDLVANYADNVLKCMITNNQTG